MWCALHKHMLLVCSALFYIVPHAQVVIWCTVHMLICVRCIHREYLLLAVLAAGNLLHHMAQAQAPFSMESTWTYTRASIPARKLTTVWSLLNMIVEQTLLQAIASVCFPPLTKCQGRCFWKSREQMGMPWHLDHCDISLELHLKLQV